MTNGWEIHGKRCSTSLRNSNQNQNNINRTIIVKKIDLTSADNDAEKQNPHTLLGIRRSGTATVKNNLAVSQKIKHGDAIWSNFTPRHIPKGKKKWKHMFMQKRVNKCHSSIIYDRQMVEVIQMPTYQWMDKKNLVNPHNGILFRHIKKGKDQGNNLAHATTWANLKELC